MVTNIKSIYLPLSHHRINKIEGYIYIYIYIYIINSNILSKLVKL